jgi:hypothetical protein
MRCQIHQRKMTTLLSWEQVIYFWQSMDGLSAWINTPIDTTFEAATCFLKADQIDEGNKKMVEHYRSVLDEIQKEAEAEFPKRRLILEKAFYAHRQANYELSIPVMLAQAEGIYRDIFSLSPYEVGEKKFKKLIEQKLNSDSTKLFHGYFLCVTQALDIRKSIKPDAKPPFPFSRHAILHGISTDYATEINALKAVSWLQYLVSFKTWAK